MRAPGPAALVAILACLAATAAGGCGGQAPSATVRLGWRFADDRTCADAGAVRVQVDVGCPGAGCLADHYPLDLTCDDGQLPLRVTVDVPAPATAFGLSAISAPGDVLYRGTLPLGDPRPADADVVLYFTGGQ